MATELLRVQDLHVELPVDAGIVYAVRGLSYTLHEREVLAIVGESGCGKSVSALAVLGLLPAGARVTGSVRYRGQEVLGPNAGAVRSLRGRRIAMVFQDPMTALNPVYTVGAQIVLAIRAHAKVTRTAAWRQAVESLAAVGLTSPAERADSYPHQLSGGQRQRAMIAMAIVNQPDVVLADEPTTALDVRVQDEVVQLLLDVTRDVGAGLLLITHDLALVAGVADRVLVMYAGQPVEMSGVDRLFATPRMPYTVGLLGAVPSPQPGYGRLRSLPGQPPSLLDPPTGCPFAARCPLVAPVCATRPTLGPTEQGLHLAACHRWEDVAQLPDARRLYDDVPGVGWLHR